MTAELGPCSFCADPAVVTVNNNAACVAHLDNAFGPVGDMTRRLRRLADEGYSEVVSEEDPA